MKIQSVAGAIVDFKLPDHLNLRHGPYVGAGDLVRWTGVKPQAALSLVEAGAFDAVVSNRRAALWDAGLPTRPSRNGQMALPLYTGAGALELTDFTEYEKMAGEYRVMGIYPRGHLREFVRPAAAVEQMNEGEEILVAGWPVARQQPPPSGDAWSPAVHSGGGDSRDGGEVWGAAPAYERQAKPLA